MRTAHSLNLRPSNLVYFLLGKYQRASWPNFLFGLLFAALGVVTCLTLTACQPATIQQQESYVFGTRVEVLVVSEQPEQARQAMAAVLREFDRLHRTYHAWQDSELSRLNAQIAAGKQRIPVNPELRDFIVQAQAVSAASQRLFDPGIGKLIALWGFQADEFAAKLPDPNVLAPWHKKWVGIGNLRLDGVYVSSDTPDVALDFGGYLKGVALDRAATILRQQGIHNALINIGGNIMALGSKNGTPWKVGIQHPRQPGPIATLSLNDGEAIGTSGDYQRFFELDGKRYCHLLDPRKAAPVHHTQAVTILIPAGDQAGTRSDAYSKPIFIAGADNWPALAKTLGLSHVLRIDAEGKVQATPAMVERLKFSSDTPVQRIEP